MNTIYMTSDSETKLKSIYSNLKNYYILDVQAFVKSLNLDLSKQSSIFIINEEIQTLVSSQLKLKKYKGVIYINKNLSKDLYSSFKQYFKKYGEDIKIVLIDNGQFPKHQDIMQYFDEVIFYERFRKNKIIEFGGFEKNSNNIVNNIIMDENEPNDTDAE